MSLQIIYHKRDSCDEMSKTTENDDFFFASIFSGPGELLGKSRQIKSKAFPVIYYD